MAAAAGAGVIRKRRKGLQVQVFAGRDPLTGRKRWLSRQVDGQTKAAWREAKKVEAQLLEQVDRGERRNGRSRTIGELVERWLEWRQQVRPISPVTVANYRGAIDRYILPNLGRAMLHEVDAATLDTLYARVRATGGKCRVCWKRIRWGEPALRPGVRYRPRPGADEAVHEPDCTRGWPVSASAVREVHSVLSGAFKQAVVWGWTTHNPAKLATPPAAGRAEVAPPDAQGVARLLTVAMDQDPELGLFLRLAVVLGARRSELIALKWRDVDLAAGEVLNFLEMATRPQTIGYALLDSPVALAAWLLDHDTDSYYKISRAFVGGEPVGSLTRDSIVDNITLYWLTGTAASAARSYWEDGRALAAALASGQPPPAVKVPVGFTTFPGEIWASPRSWVEAVYPDLAYFNEADKGGHFAAWEEPELFSEEVRAAFRSLR
jgi:hypothetical protein